MDTYYVTCLEDGETEEVRAKDLADACSEAEAWIRAGDWKEGGCDIRIRVESEDGEEEKEFSVYIPTVEEAFDSELEQSGKVVAESVGEYSTEKLVLYKDECYHMYSNGGKRGSYDRMCGDGVWRERPVEPTRTVDYTEAVALMLDWGYEDVSALDDIKEAR